MAYVKSAQLLTKNADDKSEWTINLLEEIVGYWSTNLHLKVFNLVENIFDFLYYLKQDLGLEVTQQKASKVYNLHMCGIVGFHVKISEKHSAKVSLGTFKICDIF